MDTVLIAKISARIHPRARRSRAVLKLDITASANVHKANEQCHALLFELTGVPKIRIRLVVGAHNPSKVLAFDGVSREQLGRKQRAAL